MQYVGVTIKHHMQVFLSINDWNEKCVELLLVGLQYIARSKAQIAIAMWESEMLAVCKCFAGLRICSFKKVVRMY